MKASELRIGNWIQSGKYNVTGIVRAIFGRDVLLEDPQKKEEWQPEIDDCGGIPLTEEWIVKFGFKKGKIGTWINHRSNRIFHVNQKDDVFFRPDGFTRRVIIEYVHQLQNLYFALTGEELAIK